MKRILQLLISVLAVCVIQTAAFAYSDMPTGEIGQAIENAVSNGLMTGYDDDLIRPDNNITRAEMAVMLTRCFGVSSYADISEFTDVSKDDWYYDAMSRSVAMGAFDGDGDRLNPENNITFQEVFAVIARVFSMEEENVSVLDRYKDGADVPEWAKEYAAMIIGRGYWGQDTEYIRPGDYITRGEFALLMNNIVTVYIDEPCSYVNDSGGNIVVRADGVTIEDPNGCELIVIGDGVTGLTKINNCADLKYLVVRGGEVYPIGTVYSIRLAMPGTVLKASDVKIDHGWGAEDTVVDFGYAG